MKILFSIGCCLMIAASAAPELVQPVFRQQRREPLGAPTYYLVVSALSCSPESVRFAGASNLPHGALVRLVVNDFNEDAWKDFSSEVVVGVESDGFFKGEIHPKNELRFRRNLVLVATFTAYSPKQTAEVLAAVGSKGENLGGSKNPQVGQLSGENYYLQTIARVPFCGEGVGDHIN